MKRILVLLSFCSGVLLTTLAALVTSLGTAHAQGLAGLPVQDGGRIKPFDTFAREALQLTWGKETFKGEDATHVVLSWALIPDEWAKSQFLQIRHNGLRKALKLPDDRIYFAPIELAGNDRVVLLMQDLKNKRDAREKLDPFFQAVQTLENQISLFESVRAQMYPRFMPVSATAAGAATAGAAAEGQAEAWLSLSQFQPTDRAAFRKIEEAFVAFASAKASQASDLKEKKRALDGAADEFVNLVKTTRGQDYGNFSRTKTELHYNRLHPFLYAWVAYLLATIFFGVLLSMKASAKAPAAGSARTTWSLLGWLALATGFLFHTYGFGLRIYIMERPPVTNMYESVVWVAWGAIIIAMVLDRFFKYRILLPAATAVGTLCLILCDLSSHVLDDSFQPLEPVLRDNFWLIVHVMTITLSYAAFFVAFMIGDVVLFWALRDEPSNREKIASAAQGIYRCLQVGVVLLTAGTILGGVWADYSWGRFWGWDPKETWAFIALMGYLVVLHGRLIGWLRDYGVAAAAVISFSLVIMAWYGVNFVLGAGLHTYGFGAGGVEYVAAFVAAHLLYVVFVTTVRQGRINAAKN
jgi:cytochrome c-type biogenesis protein CcsB